ATAPTPPPAIGVLARTAFGGMAGLVAVALILSGLTGLLGLELLDRAGLPALFSALAATATPPTATASAAFAFLAAGLALFELLGFLLVGLGLGPFHRGSVDAHMGAGLLLAIVLQPRLATLDGVVARADVIVGDNGDGKVVLVLECVERVALGVEHVERDV